MNNGFNERISGSARAAENVKGTDVSHAGLYGEHESLYINPFVGVFRCDLADKVISFINQKGLALLGLKKGNNEQLYLHDIVGNGTALDGLVLDNMEEHCNIENLEVIRSVDGSERWLSVSYQVLAGEGVLEGLLMDVTAKKLQEQHLNSMREQMDTFIYHASHELKSPLTTILGAANLLRLDMDIEKDLPLYSHLIEDQARRLNTLFKELMHVYTNNHSVILKEPVDFQFMLKELLEELSPLDPGIDVRYTLQIRSVFYSDAIRLKLILKNLISNAIKFQKPSSPGLWVRVHIESTAGQVMMSVEDNGIGMDEITMNDIFTIFFRGSEISKKGFGIGLYLVKSLVEKLEGSVEVKSQPGHGSRFLIRIPDSRMDSVVS